MSTYWQKIKRYTLITNATVYISGFILQKGTGFLLLPLWVRFLTPDDYGITGTLAAYSGVLNALLLMGLHGAVVRHYFDYIKDTNTQNIYITSVLSFQIISAFIIVLLLDFFGAELWKRFTTDTIPFHPYVRLMLWTTYAGVVIQIPLAIYRAQQKATEYAIIQYGQFLIGIGGNFLFVVALKLEAYGILLSQFSARILVLVLVLYLIYKKKWFIWQIKWSYIKSALSYGLPLVPHAFAGWVLLASDRIILEHYTSLTDIGLYNFGYKLGMLMSFLVYGINQAWVPYYFRLMRTESEPERKIIKVVSYYIVFIGGICLLGILFAPDVIYLILPGQYHNSAIYVGPILLGYFANGLYFFASMSLFYYKKTKLIPVLTAFAAILNVLLNLWLIPVYGAIAAAWTTTASFWFTFLLFFIIGRQYQKINYPLIKYGAMLFIIFFALFIISNFDKLTTMTEFIKIILLASYIGAGYLVILRHYIKNEKRSMIS